MLPGGAHESITQSPAFAPFPLYRCCLRPSAFRAVCYDVLHTTWSTSMTTLTIRLDEKLERELNRLARTQGKTKSEIARELLRRHILVRQLDEIRNKLRPYAEAA